MSDSEEDEKAEKQLKVVFLGDKYVGKTCIIRRFCYNEFIRPYISTIGAEFHIKHTILPGKKDVTLRITDVGGDEQYGTMLDKYLFNANVIILVYDITNSETFDELNIWMKTIKAAVKRPPIVAIIGNKCDLEHQRSVSTSKASKLAKELNLLSYTMSAKTGESVSAFFMDFVAKCIGIPLSKIDREYQQSVIKAELIRTQESAIIKNGHSNTSVCSIQ